MRYRHKIFKKMLLKQFTLLELLLVISIVIILAAVSMCALSASYAKSKRIKCANNQRQLIYAYYSYADDYRDLLPDTAGTVADCYKNYKLTPKIFICPNDSLNSNQKIDNAFLNRDNSVSASFMFANHYRAPNDDFSMKTPHPESIAIQWDLYGGSRDRNNADMRNHGIYGGNVTFMDGHSIWVTQKSWSADNRPVQQ